MLLPDSLFAPERHAEALADAFLDAIPANARTVLEIGCGDGTIARLLRERRPALVITGADRRPGLRRHIPVTVFDGNRLPFVDAAFDVVMCVDLLREADDPAQLLREAKRVARDSLVLKDQASDGVLSRALPRLLDWVTAARLGPRPRRTYWSSAQWRAAYHALGLTPRGDRRELGPDRDAPAFGRGQNFVSRLAV
jgi:SAM-dependent methyltransferase